jgi:hypothetical protein
VLVIRHLSLLLRLYGCIFKYYIFIKKNWSIEHVLPLSTKDSGSLFCGPTYYYYYCLYIQIVIVVDFCNLRLNIRLILKKHTMPSNFFSNKLSYNNF